VRQPSVPDERSAALYLTCRAVGASGHGDAIFGFLQGDGANTQIAAVVVRAPPGEFVMDVPNGWITSPRIPLQWEVPLAGAGQITYSILVDDQEVAEGITGDEYALTSAQIASGVHTVQVQATDSLGQVVDSEPATLKIDHTPPRVGVRVRGSSVTVSLSDEPKGESSGVKSASVKVNFGDGRSGGARTTLRHAYAHSGTYTIVISAADKAGNKTIVRKRVRVS